MTSATLTSRSQRVDLTAAEKSDQLPKKPMINERCPSEDSQYFSQWPSFRPSPRPARALSYNEERTSSTSSSSSSNPNRLKHLCSTIKRRFSISKECRTRSDEINRSFSIRFSNYKSFSSTVDEPCQEFDWPDFERIYDSIPSCLANALPGMDDISVDEDDEDEDDSIDAKDLMTDSSFEESIEQMTRFKECKRGHYFHRNGLCHKLDKTLYNGQLDTFIQQLMVEKLIRTWT